MSARPVRIELNNSGSWKVLGRFDASDEEHTSRVLHAAEALVMSLNNGRPAKQCPTLRVSMDDGIGSALMRWELYRGWYDTKTGRPA